MDRDDKQLKSQEIRKQMERPAFKAALRSGHSIVSNDAKLVVLLRRLAESENQQT